MVKMVIIKGLKLEINKMNHNESMPTPPLQDFKPNSYELNKKHLMQI